MYIHKGKYVKDEFDWLLACYSGKKRTSTLWQYELRLLRHKMDEKYREENKSESRI